MKVSKVKMSKAKYTPASQSDLGGLDVDIRDDESPELDKSNQTIWQKLAYYSCWVGFAFILAGIIW